MTDRPYRRVSLQTEHGGSIDKQTSQLAGKCAADAVWYEDRSISGATPFAERPDGARLLTDLRPGDRVLVTKIDRAARNVEDFLGLVRTIREAGATLVVTEQHIDTAGPIGDLILTILAAVAQFERDLTVERIRESRAVFEKEGRWLGGRVPFGLARARHPNGKGYVLRPHPEMADRAREGVRRVLSGEAQMQVAADLGFRQSTFSAWLRNPALAGVRGDGTVDAEAAILSASEWMELCRYLDRPARAWSKATGLAAALSCATCGQRLYLAKNRKKPEWSVYTCQRRKHQPGDASGATVTAIAADDYLEEMFLSEHGERAYKEARTIEDSAERLEAVSAATIALERAQEALGAAEDDEAEDDAYQALKAAKRALRKAEAMPSGARVEVVDAGMTVAEVWASADDEMKVEMLKTAATWTVVPGRYMPIELKIRKGDPQPAAGIGTGRVHVTT